MICFDKSKLVLITKERFSTHDYICEINENNNSSTWFATRRFPVPIAGFYTKQFISNINITIGGATIGTEYANCIAVENGWYKLQFFLNDPVLPLHTLMYQSVSFKKKLNKNELTYQWPDIYYIPAIETTDTIETLNGIENPFELIIQNTSGLYNSLRFEDGVAGIIYDQTLYSYIILPYNHIIKYLQGEIKLYKSSTNNDRADSMTIIKEMFTEYKEFLKSARQLFLNK